MRQGFNRLNQRCVKATLTFWFNGVFNKRCVDVNAIVISINQTIAVISKVKSARVISKVVIMLWCFGITKVNQIAVDKTVGHNYRQLQDNRTHTCPPTKTGCSRKKAACFCYPATAVN